MQMLLVQTDRGASKAARGVAATCETPHRDPAGKRSNSPRPWVPSHVDMRSERGAQIDRQNRRFCRGQTWGDVDWENDRLTVHSPKTEHHPGGEFRLIPLFPELRRELEAVFDLAEPGTEFIITRYRDVNANLRTQPLRIIKRAGLTPWPKLFHNLRSTRQTELEESFPSHVVCKWIGNSQDVARKHYLQVTDDHFSRAVAGDAEAVQNPVQQAAAGRCDEAHADLQAQEKPLSRSGVHHHATHCDTGGYTRRESNPQPADPKSAALSN